MKLLRRREKNLGLIIGGKEDIPKKELKGKLLNSRLENSGGENKKKKKKTKKTQKNKKQKKTLHAGVTSNARKQKRETPRKKNTTRV